MRLNRTFKRGVRQLTDTHEIPQEVKDLQENAFRLFVRGDQAGAYRQMVIILRYYQERNQHLPKPCELLYKTLIIHDIVVDHFIEQGRDYISHKLHSHRN